MIKRKSPLKRTPIKRKQPFARLELVDGKGVITLTRKPLPNKRSKPRRVSVLRDPKYRKFLREWGYCPVCFPEGWEAHEPFLPLAESAIVPQRTRSLGTDPAHTASNNGMSSKGGDDSCAPLCRIHHDEYDVDRKAFEKKYGIDMKDVAAKWYALYLENKK